MDSYGGIRQASSGSYQFAHSPDKNARIASSPPKAQTHQVYGHSHAAQGSASTTHSVTARSASASSSFSTGASTLTNNHTLHKKDLSLGTVTATIPPSPSSASSYEVLNELVQKRITTFAYLKRAHEGRVHWFNTVLITKDQLEKMYDHAIMRKRSANFFMLGCSLPQVLDIMTVGDYLKALLLLLQEYDFQSNEQQKPKMKMLFRNANKTQVRKLNDFSFQESGDYSYLIVPNTPFDLDYFQTFNTLCDILVEVYSKLLFGAQQCSPTVLETVIKIDVKLKKILTLVTKELDSLARKAIKDELTALDPSSDANWDGAAYM